MSRYRYGWFSDVILPTLVVGTLAAGIVTFAAQTYEAYAHNDCHSDGELAQVDVTYRKWNGCFANQNDVWVPFDIWLYNREHGVEMQNLGE